jgi:hypothetical protein
LADVAEFEDDLVETIGDRVDFGGDVLQAHGQVFSGSEPVQAP